MATQETTEVPEFVLDCENERIYRRLELLGEGSFGKCYKMRDVCYGEIFAVKVIPIEDSAGLEVGLQEVEILRKLQHRHVVSFSHYTEDENFMYIFMELCSKGSMVDIIEERESLTNAEVRYYMRQLISALKYMHDEGFVHRDLKLENLLVTENMELRLADFGLAAKLEPLETRHKKFCGTKEYAAPEVWEKEGQGPESDVWALGCIIYTMLLGEYAFCGKPKEIRQCITEIQHTLPKRLSRSARGLLSWIFQMNPEDRPTLDQILEHKFFTKGFTPDALPSESHNRVPEFKSVNPVKRFFTRLFQCVCCKKRSRADISRCEQQGEQQEFDDQL